MSFELSFCLIVKNEEAYLRRCVESFGSVYDELIIVDTGSTDGTVDVARSLLRDTHGRLEHFAWCDDFAAARNYACSFARSPWILMVDADEYLSPNLPPSALLELIRGAPPDVVNLLLVDLTLHEGEILFAHPVNRLFRNQEDVRWVGRIHESLTVASPNQILTDITLIHDNARKRLEHARLPADVSGMYERGLRADAERAPENARPLFYLANTLAERKAWAEARDAYHRYLDAVGRSGWSEEAWHAHLSLAMCCTHLGDDVACRRSLMEAVSLAPQRSEAYLALGDRAQRQRNLDEAKTWYQFAATLPPPASTIFVEAHAYGLKPWWKLSDVLIEQRDYAAALVASEKALRYAPADPTMLERVEQLRYALGDEEAPVTVVIPSRNPDLVRGCLQAMQEREGDVYYETIIVCDGPTAPFAELPREFRGVRLLAGEAPFVFARNANLGIEACRGDVILLNDDARPASEGWVDALQRAARASGDAGPLSPLLSTCGNPAQDLPTARAASGGEQATNVRPAEFVTFTCVYLPRDLIRTVGPLDPGFVWYGWEDNDYCQRSLAAQRMPRVVHDAVVRHDEPSATYGSPEQLRLLEQARHRFERKHLHRPAPFDVLIRIHDADPGTTRWLGDLLRGTTADCRFVVLTPCTDREFADALRGLVDPRLALRFDAIAADEAACLDVLAGGPAQYVLEISRFAAVGDGFLDRLGDLRPHEIPRLGVLALVDEPLAAATARERVGGLDLQRCNPDDDAFVSAPVHGISRANLERVGPSRGSSIDLPAWQRVATRLSRHGFLNGVLWGQRA